MWLECWCLPDDFEGHPRHILVTAVEYNLILLRYRGNFPLLLKLGSAPLSLTVEEASPYDQGQLVFTSPEKQLKIGGNQNSL